MALELKRNLKKKCSNMKLIVLIATVPNERKNPLEIKATQGNIEHTPKRRII